MIQFLLKSSHLASESYYTCSHCSNHIFCECKIIRFRIKSFGFISFLTISEWLKLKKNVSYQDHSSVKLIELWTYILFIRYAIIIYFQKCVANGIYDCQGNFSNEIISWAQNESMPKILNTLIWMKCCFLWIWIIGILISHLWIMIPFTLSENEKHDT
jgi:hypothetical protein